jgi:hypothetical protein
MGCSQVQGKRGACRANSGCIRLCCIMGSAGASSSLKQFTSRICARTITMPLDPDLGQRGVVTQCLSRPCPDGTRPAPFSGRRAACAATADYHDRRESNRPNEHSALPGQPCLFCLPSSEAQWHRSREIQRRSALPAPPESFTRRTSQPTQIIIDFSKKESLIACNEGSDRRGKSVCAEVMAWTRVL